MADKYDSNGGDYRHNNFESYTENFKRKSAGSSAGTDNNKQMNNSAGDTIAKVDGAQEPEETSNPATQKAGEYVRELLSEKLSIDHNKHPNACRLIEQEITKVQAIGKIPAKDQKYVDIYREKPIKVTVKVLVPVREHPKFNFVGKLLGPKGNSMKRLQEETMCKMAVLGKGSMKDRQKEEELRNSLDPKYAHLTDDLHVEISALGPPAEAHARVAFALAEVRKYLIPDNNDNIRQEQMREMEIMTADMPPALEEARRERRSAAVIRAVPSSRAPVPMRSATRTPVITPRVMPAKTKILSILDRARIAMEESYGFEDAYDHPSQGGGGSHHHPHHAPPPPPHHHHGGPPPHHHAAAAPPPPHHHHHHESGVYDPYHGGPQVAPPPSGVSHSGRSSLSGGGSRSYSSSTTAAHGHGTYEAEYEHHEYYRGSPSSYEPSQRWKSYKTSSSSATRHSDTARYRTSPYTRPAK